MAIWTDFDLNQLSKEFTSLLEEENLDKVEYLKQLLQYYKEEHGAALMYNQDPSTLFGYIQNKADLNKDDLPEYIKNLPSNNSFWNESINNLVNKFFSLYNIGNLINIPLSDIKKADAALDFENKWVKPEKNITGETYGTARDKSSTDREKNGNNYPVLNNSTQLQFTNDQLENGIYNRLIMPKNTRRVEVEDLNRNFWVISQQTTGVLNFIFGDNGIKDILSGLIGEVTQLWHNVFYLWCGAMLLAAEQNITKGIHCEVLYLPNNEFQPYKKYDGFDDDSWKLNEYGYLIDNDYNRNKVKARLQFLKKKYPKHDLCVLPCIRYQNYKHNYYYQECYPYLYFYDRDTDNEVLVKLTGRYAEFVSNDSTSVNTFYALLTYGIDTILPVTEKTTCINRRANNLTLGYSLYGINKEHTLYYYPYNKISVKYRGGKIDINNILCENSQEINEYEALAEIVPKLTCIKENGVLKATLGFEIYDTAARLIQGNNIEYVQNYNVTIENTLSEMSFSYMRTGHDQEKETDFVSLEIPDNCYKGELITNYDFSTYITGGEVEYDTAGLDIATQGTLLKIGDYFPSAARSCLSNSEVNYVKMQHAIDSDWMTGPVREVLDSTGNRTGIKCNLTIGNNGDWNEISSYYDGHDYTNLLNPVEDEANSIFATEALEKKNNEWVLSFNKVCAAASVNYSNDDDDNDKCGIKGLSAKMSKSYLEYAFEQASSSMDFLSSDKINYIITTIGISSWFGGYSDQPQKYQGYWGQNILCYYVRYVPNQYLKESDGTQIIPKISYNSGNKQYPISKNNVIVGYIDVVAPIDLAEGFVGEFLFDILKTNPNGSDKWRLPQLNGTNKATDTIYEVDTSQSAQVLHYYDKKTNTLKTKIIEGPSQSDKWYVAKSDLSLPANPTDAQIKEAIRNYTGQEYTAYEILTTKYGVTGIWNLFDGYTSDVTGNKERYVGGNHTHVLQIFFEYDSTFKISSTLGNSTFRRYNSSSWTSYQATEGNPLGDALPASGFIFINNKLGER